jgi:hypothetical protein
VPQQTQPQSQTQPYIGPTPSSTTVVNTRNTPNNPYISNDNRQTYQKNNSSQVPFRPQKLPPNVELKPQVKLEVFQPQLPPEKPTYNYPLYGQNIGPNTFIPTSVYNPMPNLQLPVQKIFNITMPNPTGSGHVQMNQIYESVLPGKDYSFTFATLGERLSLYHYLRQIFFKRYDGIETSLDGRNNSILSYIKLLDINQLGYSNLTNNPYKILPYGLLVYKSCYPVRYDEISSVTCQRQSTGINLRIYSLSHAEYCLYKCRNPLYLAYDVWRELAYYEYVREEILKKKICPNFVMLYGFNFCSNRNIDFFKLKQQQLTQKDMITLGYQRFITCHTHKILQNIIHDFETALLQGRITTLPDESDPNLQAYSGNCLILMTEAPTNNMYSWGSRIYDSYGVVKKMISNGYYNDKIWQSIIFQLMAAMYVMYINGLYLRDMTIADNVYIKDLYAEGNVIGYWKYIIDGIDYYIPNYGYMVMIDTNYKDIIIDTQVMQPTKRQYKFYANNMFGKNYREQDLNNLIMKNFKNLLSTNNFSTEQALNDINRPSESIMKLLSRINNDTSTSIGDIIFNNMTMFLNNRIGTYLKKDIETVNIRNENYRKFKRGDLVIHEIGDQMYIWAMYIGEVAGSPGSVTIATKDNPTLPDIIVKQILVENLRQYSPSETVEQNFKPTEDRLSESDLLETYIISK